MQGVAQPNVSIEKYIDQASMLWWTLNLGNLTNIVAARDASRQNPGPVVPPASNVEREIAKAPARTGRNGKRWVSVADEPDEFGAVEADVLDGVVGERRRGRHRSHGTEQRRKQTVA